jgi:hypothetical protein
MIRLIASTAALALIAFGLAGCGDDATEGQGSDAPHPDLANLAPVATTSVAAAIVPAGSYAPRDNCGIDPSGAQFRSALANAVAARDSVALLKLASPAMKLDFGGGSGESQLRERLSAPRGGGGWADLSAILQLGCVIYEGRMVMPSFFTREFPDPYTAMIVMGEDVPLRLAPDVASAPVSMLSWQAVQLSDSLEPAKPFQHVRLTTGSEGYVPTQSLRSVLASNGG